MVTWKFKHNNKNISKYRFSLEVEIMKLSLLHDLY